MDRTGHTIKEELNMARKIKPFKGWLPVPVLPAAQVQATSYAQHLAYLEWYIDYLSEQVALCEVLANKVTSIDADSTDEQYPSAKAVYTRLEALSTALTLLSGQISDMPRIRVNIPLQGGEDDLTSLEYDNTLYAIPQGGGSGQREIIKAEVAGVQAAATEEKAAIAEAVKVGTTLSVNANNEIVIPAGVTKVLISGRAGMTSVAAGNLTFKILKNSDESVASFSGTTKPAASGVSDVAIPAFLYSVSGGDKIYAKIAGLEVGQYYTAILQVEVIE